MKVTYLSHSCFLIETGKKRIIIDPFLKGNDTAKMKPDDVKCDTIIVTHAHSDHLGDAVEIAKSNKALVISTFEICRFLGSQGVEKTHGMNIGGSFSFPFGRVKQTIAHHTSSYEVDGKLVTMGVPTGILIIAEGKTIYHAGDTALFLDMKLIGELNKIDLALLPIGDNFTMGIDDAVKATEFLNPKLVAPMHYGTFPQIKVDPNEFRSKVEAKGFKAKVLEVGETIAI